MKFSYPMLEEISAVSWTLNVFYDLMCMYMMVCELMTMTISPNG